MQFEIFIIIYALIGVVFYHYILFEELKRILKQEGVLFFLLILIFTIVISTVIGTITIPFALYNYRKQKIEDKVYKNKALKENPRKLNPGLYKLFLSRVGLISTSFDQQTLNLNIQYDKKDWYAITIVYDFDSLHSWSLGNLKKRLDSFEIDLLLVYIDLYLDDDLHSGDATYVYESISNSNYSLRFSDNEISGSALSLLLGLEIDGKNKLVLFNRREPKKALITNLDEFRSIDFDNWKNQSDFISISNIDHAIVDFMSLIWVKSKLKENRYLKEIAIKRKEEVISGFHRVELMPFKNILEAVLSKDFLPGVMFSLVKKAEKELLEEEKVAELAIIESTEKACEAYPKFTKETIDLLKKSKTRIILRDLAKNKIYDFKARMFLKSSVILIRYLKDAHVDYSAIVIGYCKFIEQEVNLSIVQGIRKEMGINMPKYYNNYCDDGGKYRFKKGRFSVDLNKSINGKYIPPGLGQSFICLSLFDKKVLPVNQVEFSEEGIKFSKLRNRCAHPELVTVNHLNEAELFIARSFFNGCLTEMCNLKDTLAN